MQEFNPPPEWLSEVVLHPPKVEQGHLIPNDAPGLGIDLDEEAAEAQPFQDGEPPHLRRADGSVTDW